MCGFITILFIAWGVMIGVFSVQGIQYLQHEDSIQPGDSVSNQSNSIQNHNILIKNQKNTLNSFKETIIKLNQEIVNLKHQIIHIKSYVNLTTTNLVTHDTLNDTTKELHSNIKSFGEKVELVNSIGEIKINDSHYYLTNMIEKRINNLESRINKNITQMDKGFERRTNNIETEHGILKTNHLRYRENTKNNITDIKTKLYSYNSITNNTLGIIRKNVKSNSIKTTSATKLINSLSSNISKIKENNNKVESRVEQLEKTINETRSSLKIYLNECPEGWTLYTNMISLYVCYKN